MFLDKTLLIYSHSTSHEFRSMAIEIEDLIECKLCGNFMLRTSRPNSGKYVHII